MKPEMRPSSPVATSDGISGSSHGLSRRVARRKSASQGRESSFSGTHGRAEEVRDGRDVGALQGADVAHRQSVLGVGTRMRDGQPYPPCCELAEPRGGRVQKASRARGPPGVHSASTRSQRRAMTARCRRRAVTEDRLFAPRSRTINAFEVPRGARERRHAVLRAAPRHRIGGDEHSARAELPLHGPVGPERRAVRGAVVARGRQPPRRPERVGRLHGRQHRGRGHRHRRRLHPPRPRGNLWPTRGEIAGNGIDDDGNGFVDDVNGCGLRQPRRRPDPTTTATARTSPASSPRAATTGSA